MKKNENTPHQMVYLAWDRMKEKWPNELSEPESICTQKTVRLNYYKHGDAAPYISQLNSRVSPKFIPINKNVDQRLQLLSRCFDSIRMSFDNVPDHEYTYVVSNTDDVHSDFVESLLNPSSFTDINTSRKRVAKLAEIWIAKAKQLIHYNSLDLSSQICSLEKSRYLLLGKPGIGKTAFINYLFSVNSDALRKNNIFLVRVDLSDSNDRNLSLSTKMYAKFFRIFCMHYLYAMTPFSEGFIEELKLALMVKAEQYDPRLAMDGSHQIDDIVEKYISLMHKIRDDSSIRLSYPSAWEQFGINKEYGEMFTRHLIVHLQKKHELGYIFIFDGLDSITIDSVRHNDYRKWLADLTTATDNERNPYRALYIITMRDYSYIGASQLFNDQSMPQEKRFIKCRVIPSDAALIVSKRCSFAAFKASNSYPEFIESKARNVFHNIAIILVSLLSAKKIPTNSLSKLTFNKCVKILLNRLNRDNIRILFRLLREFILVVGNILRDKDYSSLISDPSLSEALSNIDKSHWRLYRILLYGSASQAIYTNKFSYDCNGEMHDHNNNRALMPNIFNYRDIPDDEATCMPSHCLIKKRIIQYINGCPSRTAKIEEVVSSVSNGFGYPISKIRYETMEMIYGGLLEPHIPIDAASNLDVENKDYEVSLTAIEAVISGRLLAEPIYYETVCDDTPIAIDVASRMECINRYDSAVDLSDYIIRKTKTIMQFLIYLSALDQIQLDYLQLNNEFDELPYEPIFTNSLINLILDGIVSYVVGFYRHKFLPTCNNNFVENWEKVFDIEVDRSVTIESEYRS